MISQITTGERWDDGKPASTVNIAFTHQGLAQLGLPEATLLSFPLEFKQGMKARNEILCDTGRNAPERWDVVVARARVQAWMGVYARSPAALDEQCSRTTKDHG